MRIYLVGVAALVAAGSILACEELFPSPVTPDTTQPVYGDELAKACGSACERLRTLSCPEGTGSLGGESCAVTCMRASTLRPLPLACWADAGDVATLRSCGSVRCIR